MWGLSHLLLCSFLVSVLCLHWEMLELLGQGSVAPFPTMVRGWQEPSGACGGSGSAGALWGAAVTVLEPASPLDWQRRCSLMLSLLLFAFIISSSSNAKMQISNQGHAWHVGVQGHGGHICCSL